VIEQGVVRSSMLSGGILSPLRLRNDWVCLFKTRSPAFTKTQSSIQPSIDLALRHVPDLSENELIETLNIVVNSNSIQSVTTDPSAMQVDSASLDQVPSLSVYLASMLKYNQFTSSQLIIALRHHLRSAEAVTLVTQLLNTWLKKVQSQEVKLMPSKHDVAKNEHGVFVAKKDMTRSKLVQDLPSTTQVSDFILL